MSDTGTSDQSLEARRLTGMVRDTFAPLGQHDVRPHGRLGALPSEMAALGLREAAEASSDGSPADPPIDGRAAGQDLLDDVHDLGWA